MKSRHMSAHHQCGRKGFDSEGLPEPAGLQPVGFPPVAKVCTRTDQVPAQGTGDPFV